MRKIILCVICIVIVSTIPAQAADNGFYVGGSIGGSDFEISDLDPDLGDLRFDKGDTSYKLFAGFRFLSFLAVEAGYVDLGSPTDYVGEDGIKIDISLKGWEAFGLGILPVGPVDLFAKVGVISWDADIRAALFDEIDRESDSGTDLAWGLGVALRLGSVALRVEGERYEIQDADEIYSYMVGATWTF